jgi:hypothetical protein
MYEYTLYLDGSGRPYRSRDPGKKRWAELPDRVLLPKTSSKLFVVWALLENVHLRCNVELYGFEHTNEDSQQSELVRFLNIPRSNQKGRPGRRWFSFMRGHCVPGGCLER